MAQIRIDAVQKSKSGKAWQVRSGESWYTAYLDSGIDRHVGEVLEVEIKTFGKDGKAIDKYKVVGSPSGAPTSTPTPQTPSGQGVAPWWMPFASNVCAHAIQAGSITGPDGLKAWVLAAKEAAEHASKNDVNF
jgi:hypothetical protein